MSEEGEQASVTSAGGLWLVEPLGTQSIFSAEQLTEEQLAFAETASAFVMGEVLPRQKEIDDKTPGVLRDLLSKAGALGLLMLDVPERFGGLGTDKTTSMLVTEHMAKQASWAVTMGAHVGIGSLPVVFFGNDAQKQKYLPKLATGELVAAYALTEAGSGSDALAAKTTAAPADARATPAMARADDTQRQPACQADAGDQHHHEPDEAGIQRSIGPQVAIRQQRQDHHREHRELEDGHQLVALEAQHHPAQLGLEVHQHRGDDGAGHGELGLAGPHQCGERVTQQGGDDGGRAGVLRVVVAQRDGNQGCARQQQADCWHPDHTGALGHQR